MSNVNHVNTIQIETGDNATASITGGRLNALADGQFALVSSEGLVALTAVAAAALAPSSSVYIALGEGGGSFSLSGRIQGNMVTATSQTAHVAAVRQAQNVGSLTEGLTIADESEYNLNILFHQDHGIRHQKQVRAMYSVKTGVGATQYDVAWGIKELFEVKKQNGTVQDFGSRFVDLNVLTTVVHAEDTIAAVDMAPILNSSFATITTDDTHYDTDKTIAAGDVLIIQTYDGNGNNIDVCYKVKSFTDTGTAGLIEFTTPVRHINGRAGGATSGVWDHTDIHVLSPNHSTPVTLAAMEFYFRIEALDPMDDWNGIDTNETIRFDSVFSDVSAGGGYVNGTVATAYNPGVGTANQVFDMEYAAAGYKGVNSRVRWYDAGLNAASRVNMAWGYDTITIGYNAAYRTDFQNMALAPKTAQLFFNENDSVQANSFIDILNAYFNMAALGHGDFADF